MKREYESPDFEVIAFDSADVITASPETSSTPTSTPGGNGLGLF